MSNAIWTVEKRASSGRRKSHIAKFPSQSQPLRDRSPLSRIGSESIAWKHLCVILNDDGNHSENSTSICRDTRNTTRWVAASSCSRSHHSENCDQRSSHQIRYLGKKRTGCVRAPSQLDTIILLVGPTDKIGSSCC